MTEKQYKEGLAVLFLATQCLLSDETSVSASSVVVV